MQPPKPPKITAVEVVPAQPTEADSAKIAYLSAQSNRSLPQFVHVVKVELKTKPPATSMAWALYVGDELIPKYWEYDEGIYFTVLDPQFLADHKGERLRFTMDGVQFHDTGIKLPAPAAARTTRASKGRSKAAKGKAGKARAGKGRARGLPTQADVLK